MNVKTMSINSQMGAFKEGFYLCLRVRVYLNFLSDLLLTFNTMKCIQNLWKWVPACSDVHIHPVHRTDGLLFVCISAVSHMKTAAAKGLQVGSRNPDQSLKTALCGRHTKNEKPLNRNVSFTNISYYYCHYYLHRKLISPRHSQKYNLVAGKINWLASIMVHSFIDNYELLVPPWQRRYMNERADCHSKLGALAILQVLSWGGGVSNIRKTKNMSPVS